MEVSDKLKAVVAQPPPPRTDYPEAFWALHHREKKSLPLLESNPSSILFFSVKTYGYDFTSEDNQTNVVSYFRFFPVERGVAVKFLPEVSFN